MSITKIVLDSLDHVFTDRIDDFILLIDHI